VLVQHDHKPTSPPPKLPQRCNALPQPNLSRPGNPIKAAPLALASVSYSSGKKLMDTRKVNVTLGGHNAGEHLLI
jgi:hypothetical protein